MDNKPMQLILPGLLSEDIDEFVALLSELKGRIEAGEDISNNISRIETELPLLLATLKENNNEQLRCVTVEWTGPFSIDQVLQMRDKEDDYGVYQIYGYHRVFGAKSLLYIGQTIDQTFGQRFTGHNRKLLRRLEEVSIHVGRIVNDYDVYERKQLIEDTEALTINQHIPPYNSNNIDKYNGRLLKVINTGKFGKLQREYVSRERK